MMVNIAHVWFPAASVTMSSYTPLVDMVVQLANGTPLSIAVTPGKVSEKVIVTGRVQVMPFVTPVKVGKILSIQSMIVVVCI